MKEHTTNYHNAFIEVSEDCPALSGEVPPDKGEGKTIAGMQYELVSKNPYKYTSDDIFFKIYAIKNDLTEEEYEEARKAFFSKGQPCFRASPLPKRYGWGIHSNEEGKVALYGRETEDYKKISRDQNITVVKAMRNSK